MSKSKNENQINQPKIAKQTQKRSIVAFAGALGKCNHSGQCGELPKHFAQMLTAHHARDGGLLKLKALVLDYLAAAAEHPEKYPGLDENTRKNIEVGLSFLLSGGSVHPQEQQQQQLQMAHKDQHILPFTDDERVRDLAVAAYALMSGGGVLNGDTCISRAEVRFRQIKYQFLILPECKSCCKRVSCICCCLSGGQAVLVDGPSS